MRVVAFMAGAVLAGSVQLLGSSRLHAQHPPVSGFYREEEWITLSDFRHVTTIVAGDDAAYVGTAGGLEILSSVDGRWSGTVTTGDGLPAPVITALAFEPSRGAVWIGTPHGLAIYDPFRGEVLQDPLRIGPGRVREIRVGGGFDVERGSRAGTGRTGGGLGGAGGGPQAYVLLDGRWYRSDPFTSVSYTQQTLPTTRRV
jgi:hypothetical protein